MDFLGNIRAFGNMGGGNSQRLLGPKELPQISPEKH